MRPLPLARFIQTHRARLDAVIATRLGQDTNPHPTDAERRRWVLNDEPLYRWWQTNSPSPGDPAMNPTTPLPDLPEREARATIARILGAGATISENRHAPTPEAQAQARAALPALVRADQDAAMALERRRAAVLAKDARYQALLTTSDAARIARQSASNAAHIVRYEVGASRGGVLVLVAKGNTWRELVDDLKRVKKLGHLSTMRATKGAPRR